MKCPRCGKELKILHVWKMWTGEIYPLSIACDKCNFHIHNIISTYPNFYKGYYK